MRIIHKYPNNIRDDKSKKEFRKESRKGIDEFSEKIIRFKSENKSEKLNKKVREFDEFYRDRYLNNDYSLESIAANNTSEDRKPNIEDALIIIIKRKIHLLKKVRHKLIHDKLKRLLS